MEAQVAIGANRSFILKHAVLVYGDGRTAFATLHTVVSKGANEIPYLGPGQALTSAFLKTLAAELGARVTPEVLPANVLAESLVNKGGPISRNPASGQHLSRQTRS
jgi:hypothetical protein